MQYVDMGEKNVVQCCEESGDEYETGSISRRESQLSGLGQHGKSKTHVEVLCHILWRPNMHIFDILYSMFFSYKHAKSQH